MASAIQNEEKKMWLQQKRRSEEVRSVWTKNDIRRKNNWMFVGHTKRTNDPIHPRYKYLLSVCLRKCSLELLLSCLKNKLSSDEGPCGFLSVRCETHRRVWVISSLQCCTFSIRDAALLSFFVWMCINTVSTNLNLFSFSVYSGSVPNTDRTTQF